MNSDCCIHCEDCPIPYQLVGNGSGMLHVHPVEHGEINWENYYIWDLANTEHHVRNVDRYSGLLESEFRAYWLGETANKLWGWLRK